MLAILLFNRPNHLSRVSMKEIWLPTSTAAVGRNVWKRIRAAFSVFFSKATLQVSLFKILANYHDSSGVNLLNVVEFLVVSTFIQNSRLYFECSFDSQPCRREDVVQIESTCCF